MFPPHELGVNIDFQPVFPEDYAHWIANQEQARFMVTLLVLQIRAGDIAQIADIINE